MSFDFINSDPNAFHESEEILGRELTIKFFIEESFKATEKGCTHWGTMTDKSVQPWKTKLVFFKPAEAK